jgi:hypothetical protein
MKCRIGEYLSPCDFITIYVTYYKFSKFFPKNPNGKEKIALYLELPYIQGYTALNIG